MFDEQDALLGIDRKGLRAVAIKSFDGARVIGWPPGSLLPPLLFAFVLLADEARTLHAVVPSPLRGSLEPDSATLSSFVLVDETLLRRRRHEEPDREEGDEDDREKPSLFHRERAPQPVAHVLAKLPRDHDHPCLASDLPSFLSLSSLSDAQLGLFPSLPFPSLPFPSLLFFSSFVLVLCSFVLSFCFRFRFVSFFLSYRSKIKKKEKKGKKEIYFLSIYIYNLFERKKRRKKGEEKKERVGLVLLTPPPTILLLLSCPEVCCVFVNDLFIATGKIQK